MKNDIRKEFTYMNNTVFPWEFPVFFRKNRVFRVYLGGKLLDEFIGAEGEDGSFPEEWICSAVRAINPGHTDPLEGSSLRDEDGMPFDKLIEENKIIVTAEEVEYEGNGLENTTPEVAQDRENEEQK